MACVGLFGSYGLLAHELRVSMRLDEQPLVVKRLAELELTQDDIASFLSGQWAFECCEGDNIPLFVDIGGDFFEQMVSQEDVETLIKPTLRVQAAQHFYMRWVNNAFAFSDDLEHWSSFEEFFTGEVGVSMAMSDATGEPEARMSVKLNRRRQ